MTEQGSNKRLNVFDFPVETDTRFLLLILTAFFFAVNTGQNIGRTVSILSESPGVISNEPEYSQSPVTPGKNNNLRSYEENIRYNKEVFINSIKSLSYQFVFVVLLFCTAIFIYAKYPSRIIRDKRLKQFDYSRDKLYYESIWEVSNKFNIRLPVTYSAPVVSSTTAQAFGYKKEQFLRIDHGLRILLRKSRSLYNAVLFHEFGHIINKDIFKTYFTQSIWYASLIIFVIPLLISLLLNFLSGVYEKLSSEGLNTGELISIFTVNLPALVKIVLQYIALFMILAYIRSSLLKIREYYADQRAVEMGSKDSLIRILSINKNRKKPGWIRNLFMLHPGTDERIAAINNPGILFRAKGELAFITGILIAILINGLFYPFMSFLLFVSSIFGFGGSLDNFGLSFILVTLAFIVPAILVFTLGFFISYIISKTICVQIIKESCSNQISGSENSKLGKFFLMAILFSAGNELGFLLVPVSTVIATNIVSFFLLIFLQLLFSITLFISFCFCDFLGKKFLRYNMTSTNIRSKLGTITILNSFMLSFFVIAYFALRIYIVQNF